MALIGLRHVRAYTEEKVARQQIEPGTLPRILSFTRRRRRSRLLLVAISAVSPLAPTRVADDAIRRRRPYAVGGLPALGAPALYTGSCLSARIGQGLVHDLQFLLALRPASVTSAAVHGFGVGPAMRSTLPTGTPAAMAAAIPARERGAHHELPAPGAPRAELSLPPRDAGRTRVPEAAAYGRTSHRAHRPPTGLGLLRAALAITMPIRPGNIPQDPQRRSCPISTSASPTGRFPRFPANLIRPINAHSS